MSIKKAIVVVKDGKCFPFIEKLPRSDYYTDGNVWLGFDPFSYTEFDISDIVGETDLNVGNVIKQPCGRKRTLVGVKPEYFARIQDLLYGNGNSESMLCRSMYDTIIGDRYHLDVRMINVDTFGQEMSLNANNFNYYI